MKNFSMNTIIKSLAALALVGAGSSVFAASTWNFTTGATIDTVFVGNTCGTASGISSLGATINCGSVAVTAFSILNHTNTGGSDTTATGVIDAAATYAAASVGLYSGGLGVTYSGEVTSNPEHTTDNLGKTDLLMLNFGTNSVDLDSIRIGYKANSAGTSGASDADADISVFRYTGSSTPAAIAGKTTAQLITAGWSLTGNYADLSTSAAKNVNATNLYSSWWLISAYNSTYGTSTADGSGSLGNSDDFFKVLSVAGNTCGGTVGGTGICTPPSRVPEPGSLALLGLGLVSLVASRRRKQA